MRRLLEDLRHGMRFAIRGMVRHPLFSATFVLTLGLCIGAVTAVYSVADAVLWRPLPYPDADKLALVTIYDAATQGPEAGSNSVTGSQWERIRDRVERLELAVFSDWRGSVNLSADGAAAFVQQQRVSAGFFHTLGIAPFLGREFEETEDVPGGPAVAILGHELWQRTLNGDPEIVGRTVRLKGEPHTVVGVMPAGFRSSIPADVWTPIRAHRSGEGGGANYSILVRIPPGMSRVEALARIGAVEAVQSAEPDAPESRFGLEPLGWALGAPLRAPLMLLLGGILAMLLVGSANLAGLQVAAVLARRPELAVRQALGAGGGALTRQMLVENLVLGLLGGAAGVAIASLSIDGLEALVHAHFGTWQPIRLDDRSLVAALLLTLTVSLLFGLAAGLQVRRFDTRAILVGGARGSLGGGGQRLRKALLVGEVAVVTALLFSAGLLARSYEHLAGLDPGFDPENVLTVQLSLDDARFTSPEDITRFFAETLAEIRRVPGVSSAAVGLTLPYERPLNLGVRIPGADRDAFQLGDVVYVTPGFFETLDIPLLRGRAFEARDRAEAPPVVVANEAFVDRYLAEGTAIGARVRLGNRDVNVVGMVGNVQQGSGWGTSAPLWRSPTLYISPTQFGGDQAFQMVHVWFSPNWIVRTEGRPAALAPDVTEAIHRVNPDIPVARTALLSEVMNQALARPRFEAMFLVAVAGYALLLALVGLYGIVANEVVQRTPEMGLRMALGATPKSAVWTVAGSGVRLTLLGLALGAAFAALSGRWIGSMLHGVATHDPPTAGIVLGGLLLTAATASFLPAARVARLDLARVLGAE